MIKKLTFWQYFLFAYMLFEIVCALIHPKEGSHEIKLAIYFAATLICGHIDNRTIEQSNKKEDE